MSTYPQQTTAKVLFVCTGNICRSAAAERLLRAWTADGDLRVEARSAGTQARPGRPMHPRTERALARHGVRADGFASRRLSDADVDWADLVLTMTGEHRDEVAGISPRGLQKVFTVMEAAALAQTLGQDWSPDSAHRRGAELAQALGEARARYARSRGPQFDVPDPIEGSSRVHAEAVDQIVTALELVFPLLEDRTPLSDETVRMPRIPPVPRPS
ncbi:low molecular weight phosphatase family protein [Blastococcus saxobsidens]|uniref:protein-tyrosine-phosphatase n=1 Tax=Blastococcus saxobsidens TaxID=138336 RepID=A0A4Q7YCA2_9ACTN|nr:low molecular weight phosphatase family protein [Blastococcus saxobsidens]RZU34133.1 protein-tyrosine phosphatase [Blastococcus saxobsidens]